jgi:hypothetical protein
LCLIVGSKGVNDFGSTFFAITKEITTEIITAIKTNTKTHNLL